MSLLNKISTIAEAWKNVIIGNEEFQGLFDQRMDTCNKCDSNIAGICTICGCPLIAKTKSLKVNPDNTIEECPLAKWTPLKRVDEQGEFIYRNELPENLQKYFESDNIEYGEWINFLRFHRKEVE